MMIMMKMMMVVMMKMIILMKMVALMNVLFPSCFLMVAALNVFTNEKGERGKKDSNGKTYQNGK